MLQFVTTELAPSGGGIGTDTGWVVLDAYWIGLTKNTQQQCHIEENITRERQNRKVWGRNGRVAKVD